MKIQLRLLTGIAAGAVVLTMFAVSAPITSAKSDGFVLISNGSNPIGSLSRQQISKMFLKQVVKWDNGSRVLPVDLARSSSTREAFSRAIHRKSASAIAKFWQRNIFSGRASPPPEKIDDRGVVSYVQSNPGAIGYVRLGMDLSGVHVIKLED